MTTSHRRLSLPCQSTVIRDVEYQVAIDTLLDHRNNQTVSKEPCLVLPYVYVGDLNNAESYKTLKRYGITHVLNCAGYQGKRTYHGSPYDGLPIDIHYKEIKAHDSENYDMSQHFDEAFRYLDKVKKQNGCALVHCAMGINRSVAICAAYLMLQKGLSLLKTVTLLKRKRGGVLNNRAFQLQLVEFARTCGLLDSRRELDRILPRKPPPARNGFVEYKSEMKDLYPSDRKPVKYKLKDEPEFSFSVTQELRQKEPVSKTGDTIGKSKRQSNPLPSDALIENYMRKLKESSADV